MSSVIKENQIFGYWTVLGDAVEHPLSAVVKYYRCRCTCGKEKDVRESSLINKLSTSCGCKRQKNRKELNVGAEFGSWQVVNSTFNSIKNDMYYYCECRRCGLRIEGYHSELYRLMKGSCSCNRGSAGFKKGSRYGNWVIVGPGDKKSTKQSGDSYYLCMCDCGVMREVVDSSLRKLRSTSCGCSRANSQKKVVSLIGFYNPLLSDNNGDWRVVRKDAATEKKIYECVECNSKIEVKLWTTRKKCPVCNMSQDLDKEKLMRIVYAQHNLNDTNVEKLYFEIFTITEKVFFKYVLSDGKNKYAGELNLSSKRGNPHKDSPIISREVSNIVEELRLQYGDQYIVDHKDDLHPLLLEVDFWDLARMLLQGYFIEDGLYK